MEKMNASVQFWDDFVPYAQICSKRRTELSMVQGSDVISVIMTSRDVRMSTMPFIGPFPRFVRKCRRGKTLREAYVGSGEDS